MILEPRYCARRAVLGPDVILDASTIEGPGDVPAVGGSNVEVLNSAAGTAIVGFAALV